MEMREDLGFGFDREYGINEMEGWGDGGGERECSGHCVRRENEWGSIEV